MIYDESLNINQKGRQDKGLMTSGKNVVWMVSEGDGEVDWGWKRLSESFSDDLCESWVFNPTYAYYRGKTNSFFK